jgi:hypothetical protein
VSDAAPERPTPPSGSGPGGDGAAPPAAERYGPLALSRRSKEDGRALIVYAWSPERR